MVESRVHPENVSSSTDAFLMSMDTRFRHPENALSPIVARESVVVTPESMVHPENAPSPMAVTPDPRVTETNVVHPENMLAGTDVTSSPNVTLRTLRARMAPDSGLMLPFRSRLTVPKMSAGVYSDRDDSGT